MTKKPRPGAPAGNRNAAKPEGERRTSLLQIPVTPREKAALVKKAAPEKLTVYCRRILFGK